MLCPTTPYWAVETVPHANCWEFDNLRLRRPVFVKSPVTNLLSFSRGFDHRVYPTIGAIDVLLSQMPTLSHYSLIFVCRLFVCLFVCLFVLGGGHNIGL